MVSSLDSVYCVSRAAVGDRTRKVCWSEAGKGESVKIWQVPQDRLSGMLLIQEVQGCWWTIKYMKVAWCNISITGLRASQILI